MSRTTDIIVVGSGLAGLTAALACAKANLATHVISSGAGCLSIGPGCIDLLGYDSGGNQVQNPWNAIAKLDASHPYSILGLEGIRDALRVLTSSLEKSGMPMGSASDENGAPVNSLVPTILGTLKPTFLTPEDQDARLLQKASRILVVGVKGFRDCKPRLIISQLRRYRTLADKIFTPLVLPTPFTEQGRAINALDLAHVADHSQGRDWFMSNLRDVGKGHDLALLPPMLGTRADSPLRQRMAGVLGCPFIEMLSIPPGVGGLRIRQALTDQLVAQGVEFFENAEVTSAQVDDKKCVSLTTLTSGREIVHKAGAYVIATGGIISGGVNLRPGSARERIFGLEIPVPENVDDWTGKEIFDRHLVTSLGVHVDSRMHALDKTGKTFLENVFFAGRTLGGYDYASEKSGNGVAAATGWRAGNMAAQCVAGAAGPETASGAR